MWGPIVITAGECIPLGGCTTVGFSVVECSSGGLRSALCGRRLLLCANESNLLYLFTRSHSMWWMYVWDVILCKAWDRVLATLFWAFFRICVRLTEIFGSQISWSSSPYAFFFALLTKIQSLDLTNSALCTVNHTVLFLGHGSLDLEPCARPLTRSGFG
jgi:hypothetical protein